MNCNVVTTSCAGAGGATTVIPGGASAVKSAVPSIMSVLMPSGSGRKPVTKKDAPAPVCVDPRSFRNVGSYDTMASSASHGCPTGPGVDTTICTSTEAPTATVWVNGDCLISTT